MELSTEEQVVNILKDTPPNSGASQVGECTTSSGAALSPNMFHLKKLISTPAQEKSPSAFSHVHLTQASPHWVMQVARTASFNQKLHTVDVSALQGHGLHGTLQGGFAAFGRSYL